MKSTTVLTNKTIGKAIKMLNSCKPEPFKPFIQQAVLDKMGVSKEEAEKFGFMVIY